MGKLEIGVELERVAQRALGLRVALLEDELDAERRGACAESGSSRLASSISRWASSKRNWGASRCQ
jgi:hypothetical protein